MLKELLVCMEKEEKEKNLKEQLKLRRDKLQYLVNYLCITVSSKRKRWVFWLSVALFFASEIGIFILIDGVLKEVVKNLLVPFLIASIIFDLSTKVTYQTKISDLENQLLDICVFIDTYDDLEPGEEYILNYLNNFECKKYARNNTFKKEEALRRK